MTGFPINPPSAPLVYPDGRVTNEWYRYFRDIQKEIGGPVSSSDSASIFSGGQSPFTQYTQPEAQLPPPVVPVENASAEQFWPKPSLSGLGGVATTLTLTAGAGLTGGGDLTANRTFDVGAGTGITVNADDVALADTAVTPGSYTSADITIDQQGRITAAANGTAGTVTSVAQTVPTGFTVSGSPITTSGTLAIAFDTGYSLPTDAEQANWDTAFGWGDHAAAGYVDLTSAQTITGAKTFDAAVTFTPQSAPTHSEGDVFYDSTAKALSYYNDEADVTVNIGQENLVRVRNTTGVTIVNGAAVYINGSNGANLPTVALAKADARATANVLGLATHDIEDNSNGYITTLGEVNDLDTSAFLAGDELFLSTATAGALTATRPTTGFAVLVGYVTVSNISVGSIKVDTGITAQRSDLTSASEDETVSGDWAFDTHAPTVPTEIYGAGWDSSNEVPTKNAVYDKIESLPSGTVTSVAQTVPTGFTISGSPITSSGTLAIAFDTGYSLPTDASQTNWNTAFGWGDHASAGYLTSATAASTYLPLAGGTLTGDVEFDTDVSVGIGTASPGSALDILPNATGSPATSVTVRGRASDNISSVDFTTNNAVTTYGQIQGRSSDFRIVRPSGAAIKLSSSTHLVEIGGTTVSEMSTSTMTTDITGSVYFDLGGTFYLRDKDNADATILEVSPSVCEFNGNPLGRKVAVPATASSTGALGEWAADSSYFYVCTATDTWHRVAVATW